MNTQLHQNLSIDIDTMHMKLNSTTPTYTSTNSPQSLNVDNLPLATPVLKAIETAAISLDEEEISSSTDTAVSSILNNESPKASSDGSFTEEEKESVEVIKTAILQNSPEMDETRSIPNDEQEQTASREPIRSLTTKKSLWNLLRGASTAMNISGSISDQERIISNSCNVVEDVSVVLQPTSKAGPPLSKRRSFAPFPALQWSKSSRRHTLTTVEGNNLNVNSNMSGVERSLDGSVPLPSRNVDEAKVAEDAMRFADARHVIKTEQDIEVLRHLADRLEQGWKESQFELILMRSKLEESHLFFHDIQDENRHLRGQLATMSEQIVARDHDFEELQRISVEQSKKEREIWEGEKVQAVESLETQIKFLQDQLRHCKTHDSIEESDDEDEADFRDAVLFSANTSATSSIEGELQIQQYRSFESLVSPTTPTLRSPNKWQQQHVPL